MICLASYLVRRVFSLAEASRRKYVGQRTFVPAASRVSDRRASTWEHIAAVVSGVENFHVLGAVQNASDYQL